MKHDLRLSIMVSERQRGYGRLKARLTSRGATKRPGEVEVPLHITLDEAWFKRTTPPTLINLPDPPPPAAEIKS